MKRTNNGQNKANPPAQYSQTGGNQNYTNGAPANGFSKGANPSRSTKTNTKRRDDQDDFPLESVMAFGLLSVGTGILGMTIGSIFSPLTAGVGFLVGAGLGLAAAASLKDQNSDGRINIEDLLIGAREIFQWVFSWRGAMVVFGFTLVGSAYLNILSTISAVRSLGEWAPVGGTLFWSAIQMFQLIPILDELSVKASLAAMVRRQRKPAEIPVLNESLHSDARRLERRYRKREANQQVFGEFVRYALYGFELVMLVLAGNVVNFVGVEWGNIVIVIAGALGVEAGLRMFCYCGEQLMTPEERSQMRTLMASAKRTTVTLE